LAEKLRQRAPEVPVLLTTGYNEDLAQSARAPGMDVLGKPYRRSELMDRVRGALGSAGRPGPRRQASDFGAAEQ
jgi:CheY-like chemotaxis protein